MKKILLLIFVGLLLGACEENEEPVLHEEEETPLVWEFSYTIDGVQYAGNTKSGYGAGVLAAYTVPEKNSFDEYDSVFFLVSTTLSGRIEEGRVEVTIGKKYPKEQVDQRYNNINFYTLYQEDREEFIKEGSYPFSLDYKKHNSQDGIALRFLMFDEEGQYHWVTSYSTAFYGWETSVGEDAQADSNFEIIKVGTTPNGDQYVEAKFNATVFGYEGGRKTDFIREVTDGFVRFPINYMDK